MSDHTNPRRILLDLAVTLDGFIEGKNGEIDWCIMEPDMDFISFLNQIDTILFGRKSYEIWEQYRPHAEAPEMEKEIWQQIQRKRKLSSPGHGRKPARKQRSSMALFIKKS